MSNFWTLYIAVIDVHINGLVQERRNSIADALELRFLALTHQYSS